MKLILFDFDGVFVNTFDLTYDILQELGSEPFSKKEFRKILSGNPYESKVITDRVPKNPNARTPFFKKFALGLLKKTPEHGFKSVIKKLSGKYELAIVSSSLDEAIESFLKKTKLDLHFKKIYGVNSGRSKVKKIKMALKDFKVKPEDAVYVTDTLGNIDDATEAGVKSIGVTWGYHKKSTLKKGKPMAIVDKPKDLLQYIYE